MTDSRRATENAQRDEDRAPVAPREDRAHPVHGGEGRLRVGWTIGQPAQGAGLERATAPRCLYVGKRVPEPREPRLRLRARKRSWRAARADVASRTANQPLAEPREQGTPPAAPVLRVMLHDGDARLRLAAAAAHRHPIHRPPLGAELAAQPLNRRPNARGHPARIELATPDPLGKLFLRERDVELAPRHFGVARPVEEKAARQRAVAPRPAGLLVI